MSGHDPSDRELDALRSVSHGALVSAGSISLQKVLLFFTNFALTAGLSVGLYGVYALGRRLTQMLLRFGSLGANQSLVRFLPKYADDRERRNRVVGLAYVTALVTSVVVAGLTFAFAGRINALTISHGAFPRVLQLFALLFPFEVFVRLLAFQFRSLEMVEHQSFVRRLATPGARLAAVVIAFALGFSVLGVVAAVAVATAVVAAVAFWLAWTRTSIRPSFSVRRGEALEFYDHAAPNAASQAGKIFRNRIDILLIGLFLTAEGAGIYNLAVFLTSFIGIPLLAFNQLLPPIASELYSDGDTETLSSIYSTVTRFVFTGTVVIAVFQFVYRQELLAVFGSSYAEGSLVLAAFVLGRIVGCAVGATGWLLLMTDHQYLRMLNSWVLGALNVGISYVCILRFGLVGAALGTAGSLAVVNVLRLSQLYYLEGLQPFDRKFLKPATAGVGTAAVLLALRPLLSGSTLLAVGGAAGLLTFAGLLYALGLERSDRVLVRALADGYRGRFREEEVPTGRRAD